MPTSILLHVYYKLIKKILQYKIFYKTGGEAEAAGETGEGELEQGTVLCSITR
ncbi:hypothetical protein SYNTR_1812 [Candidatus Syntrophocurvum alkaliphilum]|uniref:Uncharacterized protein n=1 Tax=Candidatus Syntrophocurvum alkaliphilum TaxID=2293317 RepID=A0A6I6DE73_9FIRM|nr:hypothetical protein SYNTR_1812 [Candidatus Syntrophocurvum alkaliphilum]